MILITTTTEVQNEQHDDHCPLLTFYCFQDWVEFEGRCYKFYGGGFKHNHHHHHLHFHRDSIAIIIITIISTITIIVVFQESSLVVNIRA